MAVDGVCYWVVDAGADPKPGPPDGDPEGVDTEKVIGVVAKGWWGEGRW